MYGIYDTAPHASHVGGVANTAPHASHVGGVASTAPHGRHVGGVKETNLPVVSWLPWWSQTGARCYCWSSRGRTWCHSIGAAAACCVTKEPHPPHPRQKKQNKIHTFNTHLIHINTHI